MPKVVLPFARNRAVVPLPAVCIRCGKPATRTIPMQFSGRVVKVLGMRFYRPGPEESVLVQTPLCDGHPFMGQAKWMMVVGFLILLPFIGLGALTKPWMHHYVIAFPLIALILVGTAFVFYVFFSSIDGQGFDNEGVTATGVSRAFVAALADHAWTHDEFMAELRKNRKARKRPKPSFLISPWFFVPVSLVLAFACCAPVGWLTASFESAGTWPAGIWAGGAPVPGAPGPGGADPAGPGAGGPGLGGDKPAPPEPMAPRSLPGLIGYWPFDDGRGNAAQDQSGNGILAIIHGGDWVPGIKGTAMRLDGKKDFVDLGPEPRLSFGDGTPFTIAAWITTEADAGVISSFRRRAKAFPVIDVFVKDGHLRGWVRDDTSGFGGAKVAGGPVKDGKWHHVALVRQPDGTVELFLDAVFQARDKGKSSGGPITTDLHALGSERFAAQSKKAAPAYFAGSIDEFCVYAQALSAGDIAVLSGKKK